ncbi:hypothetical protein H2248_005529 [Termitomyces sp. 'cryptogamus']|nr:hypothetical protein H2248_005529 [Termitomyces sp. 'cryptogamus']
MISYITQYCLAMISARTHTLSLLFHQPYTYVVIKPPCNINSASNFLQALGLDEPTMYMTRTESVRVEMVRWVICTIKLCEELKKMFEWRRLVDMIAAGNYKALDIDGHG